MPVTLRHATLASGTNNPDKQVSVDAWNATHSLTGLAGKGIVFGSDGNAAEVDPHATVASRTELAGHSGVSAYLRETGREGTYIWNSSNLSAKVTADPQQVVYVAPTTDTTGASGAWVRTSASQAVDQTTLSGLITNQMQASLAPGYSFSLKDVALSNSQAIFGTGQIVSVASGAANLAALSDYNPRLGGIYVSDGTAASDALIRLKKSRYANVRGVTAVNCGLGFIRIVPVTPSTDVIALPVITECDAEGITNIGVEIGSSVSELRATNLHLSGALVTGTGGNQRPMFTTIGWRQNTTVVNGLAVGGHQIVSVNTITVNRGFHLTDAQLSQFSGCVADSCSDYGVYIDGASTQIRFANMFVGTTRGIYVGGSSTKIHFDGLTTTLTGTIPPWGSTDFFNGVATFYDLEVRGTANVRVSNWIGEKRIAVDSGAKLVVDGGQRYNGRCTGTIGAASTTYLSDWGATPTEGDAAWRAPYDGYLICLTPTVTVAPGSGQSFTYTARVNGADTTLVATISGTAFGAVDTWSGTPISVNKGDQISIKLVTSATAAAARHSAVLHLALR